MTQNTPPPKPLKTWTHLTKQRRRPSEYEIVSTNLHFSTNNPDCPWELDPELAMNRWYRQYRESSPLQHDDWDGFRDPDELVYRTYNIVQDGQENYVDGLIDEFNDLEHDKGIREAWVDVLQRAYTPARYLQHGMQIASAYLAQIAPASTITNCAIFQAADSLRWLSRTAYRTRELANTWPAKTFASGERNQWEKAPAWQGFRELLERALVSYDWGEAFTVICLILKPAIDEACVRQLGLAARRNGDDLLGLLNDAQLRDSERHRRWANALVNYALQNEANFEVLDNWINKWVPLSEQAIEAYCEMLPDSPSAADDAKREAWAFRAAFSFTA